MGYLKCDLKKIRCTHGLKLYTQLILFLPDLNYDSEISRNLSLPTKHY